MPMESSTTSSGSRTQRRLHFWRRPLGGTHDSTLYREEPIWEEHVATIAVGCLTSRLGDADESARMVPRFELLLVLNEAG